jgi:hypothetical protein
MIAIISFPTVKPFRPQPAAIHMVVGATANAHNAPIFYASLQPTAIRAENTSGLDPRIGDGGSSFVHAFIPCLIVRSAFTPDVLDAVSRTTHEFR